MVTRPPVRQFTAKQLEKLAKKAEKDSKAEQAKVKKVSAGAAAGPGLSSCGSCAPRAWAEAEPFCGAGQGWRLLGLLCSPWGAFLQLVSG